MSIPLERFRGSLLGLAAGDALGAAVEFRAPGTFPPVRGITGGGPFNLPVGAWTDDTSMALCLAESLTTIGGFDPVDQLRRYLRWYREGHLSSTGVCFDIGIQTRAALERFEQHGDFYPGDAAPEQAGNGALMRLAPIPLAWAYNPGEAIQNAGASSRVTHGGQQSTDACRYFAGLLLGALGGATVEDLLGDAPYEPIPGLWNAHPLHPEVTEVAQGSFRARRPPEIKGSGYVVRSLEAALWALYSTDSFEEGALAVVNLGDDADTTGAIFGQIAGAIYGADGIPSEWREVLVQRELITGYADDLYALARRGAPIA